MKILTIWIIINSDGQIIDHELHWPFTYLRSIEQGLENPRSSYRDSEQVRLGALKKLSAIRCQLSGLNPASDPFYASEQFLDLVRFEGRSKLDELLDDWNAPERCEEGWNKVGRDDLFK